MSEGKYKFTFTPAPDMLLEKYGVYIALVFGRIRRYCEMQEGVCKASQQSIADWLGIKRWTVSRAINTLKEDEYIIDRTPNRRFRPHIYEVTSKLEDEQKDWLEAKQKAKAEKYEAENNGEKFAGDTGIGVAKNLIEAVPTNTTEAPCGSEPHGVELRTPRSVVPNPMECSSEPLKESIKETLEESIKEKIHTTLSEKPATNKPFVDIPAIGSSLRDSDGVEFSENAIPAEKSYMKTSHRFVLKELGLAEFENANQEKEFDQLENKYNSKSEYLFLIILPQVLEKFELNSIDELLHWFNTNEEYIETLIAEENEKREWRRKKQAKHNAEYDAELKAKQDARLQERRARLLR